MDLQTPWRARRMPDVVILDITLKDRSGVDVRGVWNLVRLKVKDVPGFEVAEEVFLSTFSFAKYLMWKDLTDRTETLKGTPFVRHLIETPRDPYPSGTTFLDPRQIDHKIPASSIFAPVSLMKGRQRVGTRTW